MLKKGGETESEGRPASHSARVGMFVSFAGWEETWGAPSGLGTADSYVTHPLGHTDSGWYTGGNCLL